MDLGDGELPGSTKWVLALDADFEIMPDLRKKLQTDLKNVSDQVRGIYVIHVTCFGGSEIKHGVETLLDAHRATRLREPRLK